jgi:predicted hydrocarbon binding protein
VSTPLAHGGGPVAFPDEGSIRHGDIRYVLIRADGLMGAFNGDGSERLQDLSESVYLHGRHSLARYYADCGGDIEATIKAIESRAAQMGWGRWKIVRSHPQRLTLTVDNSPFAIGRSVHPQCAPAAGMFRAVAELALGGPVYLLETRCVACGAQTCEFQASLNAR